MATDAAEARNYNRIAYSYVTMSLSLMIQREKEKDCLYKKHVQVNTY